MFELCVCWGEGGHDAITAKTGRMVGGGACGEHRMSGSWVLEMEWPAALKEP